MEDPGRDGDCPKQQPHFGIMLTCEEPNRPSNSPVGNHSRRSRFSIRPTRIWLAGSGRWWWRNVQLLNPSKQERMWNSVCCPQLDSCSPTPTSSSTLSSSSSSSIPLHPFSSRARLWTWSLLWTLTTGTGSCTTVSTQKTEAVLWAQKTPTQQDYPVLPQLSHLQAQGAFVYFLTTRQC